MTEETHLERIERKIDDYHRYDREWKEKTSERVVKVETKVENIENAYPDRMESINKKISSHISNHLKWVSSTVGILTIISLIIAFIRGSAK